VGVVRIRSWQGDNEWSCLHNPVVEGGHVGLRRKLLSWKVSYEALYCFETAIRRCFVARARFGQQQTPQELIRCELLIDTLKLCDTGTIISQTFEYLFFDLSWEAIHRCDYVQHQMSLAFLNRSPWPWKPWHTTLANRPYCTQPFFQAFVYSVQNRKMIVDTYSFNDKTTYISPLPTNRSKSVHMLTQALTTHKCFMVSHCKNHHVELASTSDPLMSYYYHCDRCGKYSCDECVDQYHPICDRRFSGDRTRWICDCGNHLEGYVCYWLHGDLDFVINCSKPTWRDPSGRKKNRMQIEEICRILRSTFTGVWDWVGVELDSFARLEGQRIIRLHTTNFKVKVSSPSLFEVIQQIEVSLQTMTVQIEGLRELRGGFQLLTGRAPGLDIRVTTKRDGAVQAVVKAPVTRKKKIIETIYESRECVICLGNPSEVVFSPCGHLCACKACGDRLEKCCICRVDIQAIVPHDQRLDMKKDRREDSNSLISVTSDSSVFDIPEDFASARQKLSFG
jgi:hypothetical protein